MTLASDVLSSLPVILTAISAIAAASIAYLNYRSRPILIRTLERHSDDLKALALQWRGELPFFPRLEEGLFPDVTFPLRVESELLFADVWEHVPTDLDLREAWSNFRVIAEEHSVNRRAFLDSIRTEVEKLTGLSQNNNIQKRGYTSSLTTFLFRDTFEMLKRNALPNTSLPLTRSGSGELTLLLAGSHGLTTGNQEDIQKVEKVWTNLVRGIEKETPELHKAALALVEQETRFWNTRERLKKLINEFTVIPLYSTRCKYVKRAEGTRKRRLKLRRLRRTKS